MSKYDIAIFIVCSIEGFICYLIGYKIGITHEKRTNTHECVKDTHYKTEPTISKMEQVDKPQTDCGDFADRLAYERGVKHAWEVAQKVFDSTVTFYEAEDVAKQIDKDINVRSKDEPQTDIHGLTDCDFCKGENCEDCEGGKDEPQTERSE